MVGSSQLECAMALRCNLKNKRMISVRFQGKPFTITVIQVYAPTSKVDGRNINNLRCADDTTLRAENEEELKSLLMKVEEGRSHHFMAQMEKEWKQWQTLFLWSLKSLQIMTAAMKFKDAYSLEEKL